MQSKSIRQQGTANETSFPQIRFFGHSFEIESDDMNMGQQNNYC